MSDTPRTLQEQCYGTCWAATERIAQLERELAEALKWKAAIEECCVVDWSKFDDKDPLATVQGLIAWNCTMALDPEISEDARKLRDAHKEERDQWREVATELAHAIKVGNDHGYGLRIGEVALEKFGKLKEASRE